MSKKKSGLSFEEHDKLGIELQKMNDQIAFVVAKLGKVYKKETVNVALEALSALDKLRSHMDDHVCRENSGQSDQTINRVYYRANREDYKEPETIWG